jgi:hypothetical protein
LPFSSASVNDSRVSGELLDAAVGHRDLDRM